MVAKAERVPHLNMSCSTLLSKGCNGSGASFMSRHGDALIRRSTGLLNGAMLAARQAVAYCPAATAGFGLTGLARIRTAVRFAGSTVLPVGLTMPTGVMRAA